MGNYRQALAGGSTDSVGNAMPPDVTQTRQQGRTKYGFGLRMVREESRELGWPPELEQRPERNLGLHQNRPKRAPGFLVDAHQMAPSPRRAGRGAHRQRPFGGPPRLPAATGRGHAQLPGLHLLTDQVGVGVEDEQARVAQRHAPAGLDLFVSQ